MADIDVNELVAKKDRLEKVLSEWRNKSAVAKADTERLRKEIAQHLKVLKNDFGCSSFEEAKQKRDQLIQEISQAYDEMETQLNDLRNL